MTTNRPSGEISGMPMLPRAVFCTVSLPMDSLVCIPRKQGKEQSQDGPKIHS